jgi:hypothetical protein
VLTFCALAPRGKSELRLRVQQASANATSYHITPTTCGMEGYLSIGKRSKLESPGFGFSRCVLGTAQLHTILTQCVPTRNRKP